MIRLALVLLAGIVFASPIAAFSAVAVCDPTRRGPAPLPFRTGFERDHVVPLYLGGSGALANMQYQPWDEVRAKDRLEAVVCHMVCDEHSMDLLAAQTAFRSDW
jgi:hypothetical protein